MQGNNWPEGEASSGFVPPGTAHRAPARRTHDGVVNALRSNFRWCSDHLERSCRNGESVRVLFAIDACDREIIAWPATTAGISGEMLRNRALEVKLVSPQRRCTSASCGPVAMSSDSNLPPNGDKTPENSCAT
jgi:transposase InsO family protein